MEVSITVKDDPERVLNYTWHIQDYDEHFLQLKFHFDEPETVSEFGNFDEVKVTFWETRFFESIEGNFAGYGTSITWGMYR